MERLIPIALLLMTAACGTAVQENGSIVRTDAPAQSVGVEASERNLVKAEGVAESSTGQGLVGSIANAYSGIDDSLWRALLRDPRAGASGLDPARNHRLVGERGEVVLIPANSLEHDDGSLATGPVEVRWAFAERPVDFVMMRAPTVSGNALLGSGGSFFLEAMQQGKPLRIKEGLDWVVRMPAEPVALFPDKPMRHFSGRRGADGEVTWTLEPQERIEMEPVTYTYFTIPQKDLPGRSYFARIDSLAKRYPERNNAVTAPSAELAMGRDKALIARMALAFYDEPRYEGTFVCSLPFMERLALLSKGVFSHTRSVGNTHWVEERGANEHIIDALEAYAAHAGSELYRADAEARARIDRADAIVGTTPGRSGLHIQELRQAHAKYAEHHLGLPVVIDDRGIDLDRSDAFDLLVARGLPMREADELLADHASRKTLAGGVRRNGPIEDADLGTERLKDGRMAVVRKRAVNTVRFSNFGYINCDRFLREEVSTPVEVLVLLGGDELKDEDVHLLLPSVNGCIRLQRDAGARVYRLPPQFYGLPIGQVAQAMVVGERDGRTHYDLVPVSIERRMSLRLEPRPGTLDELAQRVGALTGS
ncbi:MAG: hypothetical protein IPK70_03195 [Flavobacteriales bacterium]|nr:hypothetical protein [Flavobacteriales bacterium]